MKKRLTCIISGRVHGVFYRDTTSRKARALGLVGFEFLTYLWKGPSLSKVERVDAMWSTATGEFSDFRIRYRNFLDRF